MVNIFPPFIEIVKLLVLYFIRSECINSFTENKSNKKRIIFMLKTEKKIASGEDRRLGFNFLILKNSMTIR